MEAREELGDLVRDFREYLEVNGATWATVGEAEVPAARGEVGGARGEARGTRGEERGTRDEHGARVAGDGHGARGAGREHEARGTRQEHEARGTRHEHEARGTRHEHEHEARDTRLEHEARETRHEHEVRGAGHGARETGGASLPAATARRSPDERRERLRGVREDLGDCRRCGLAATRQHLVFADGDGTSGILFVGEAPGQDEDRIGLPFVGLAGQMLTDIIENVLRVPRSEVYIANVLKCRPPGNRDPEPDEVSMCSPFLLGQVEAVEPVVVVALGRFAAQTLLSTDAPISRLRGRFHKYGGGIPLLPTFHPAYLLRNPAEKRKVFDDMLLVRAEYERLTGVTLPPVRSRKGG